jgi:hypothetical protein
MNIGFIYLSVFLKYTFFSMFLTPTEKKAHFLKNFRDYILVLSLLLTTLRFKTKNTQLLVFLVLIHDYFLEVLRFETYLHFMSPFK